MTTPENPEPPIVPPVPIVTTYVRMGRGIRWSDLAKEIYDIEAADKARREAEAEAG